MKRIDENQLAARVASLKEKMAEIERQQVNEVDWGGMASNAWKGVKGALGTTGGKVAAGAALGAGALAAGQALTKPGQAAAPAGTTTKVPGKSDPAVLKQQQDLIAKGAKIKADGIMGPATQAAIKQFGGQTPAPADASADQSSAETNRLNAQNAAAGTTPPAPAADAAPQTQAQQNMAAAGMAGQEMRTQAEIDASKDLLSANNAGNINAGLTPDDPRWKGPKPMGAQGSAALAPAADGSNAATAIPSGPATAAGAPAAAPATAAAPVDTTDPLAANNAQSVGAAPAGKPGETAQAQAGAAAPTAKAPQAKPGETPQAQAQAAPVATESVGFQNDELSRIISLVHHR